MVLPSSANAVLAASLVIHVEGAPTQVEDGVGALLVFVQTIGDSSGGGFVDEAQDVQASQPGRILGGLALGIVEIGGIVLKIILFYLIIFSTYSSFKIKKFDSFHLNLKLLQYFLTCLQQVAAFLFFFLNLQLK